jgi:hypothetical protein
MLFLCCEKIHAMLHSASEIMLWGSLINSSGEVAETAHKMDVKGPGSNVNQRDSALGTLMTHARRKETARLMGSAIQGGLISYNVYYCVTICNNKIIYQCCSKNQRWQ